VARLLRPVSIGVIALTVALATAYVVVRGYPTLVVNRVAEARGGRPALPVHDLSNVGQLQTAFNAGQGTPRLILLFSPT
jgi:hypothetical protein